MTPLQHAAENGLSDVVEYLCSVGASVNPCDKVYPPPNCSVPQLQLYPSFLLTLHISQNGQTAFIKAALKGDEYTMAILVAYGSPTTWKDPKAFVAKERTEQPKDLEDDEKLGGFADHKNATKSVQEYPGVPDGIIASVAEIGELRAKMDAVLKAKKDAKYPKKSEEDKKKDLQAAQEEGTKKMVDTKKAKRAKAKAAAAEAGQDVSNWDEDEKIREQELADQTKAAKAELDAKAATAEAAAKAESDAKAKAIAADKAADEKAKAAFAAAEKK